MGDHATFWLFTTFLHCTGWKQHRRKSPRYLRSQWPYLQNVSQHTTQRWFSVCVSKEKHGNYFGKCFLRLEEVAGLLHTLSNWKSYFYFAALLGLNGGQTKLDKPQFLKLAFWSDKKPDSKCIFRVELMLWKLKPLKIIDSRGPERAVSSVWAWSK